jgi:gliding motility-associated-like protein
VTHLERAEKEGWKELTGLREEYSCTYEGSNGFRAVYQSKAPVNFRDEHNQWIPIDIRCMSTAQGWASAQRPDQLLVRPNGSARVYNRQGFFMDFSKTLSVNGQTAFDYSHTEVITSSTITFENILPGISKQYHFRYSGLKCNYEIGSLPTVSGSTFTITEELDLPEGYVLKESSGEGEKNGEEWKGNLVIERTRDKKISGKIYSLLCHDANNQVIMGSYHIIKTPTGKYRLEMKVPASWMNDPARQYPVVIDPLVTGPTAAYPTAYIPSCFFPAYSSDSINVTVPAGITVTALNITSSFYADPFTTTLMSDGRMYFSTGCGQSTVFQVMPPAGSTAGTAYLDNYNILSPLTCCHPQSCTAYNFWLSFHISRTSNGPSCVVAYLYYDPYGTSWPFSAYIEGYTPETYASEMIFVPSGVCANTCTVDAKVFVRYGVPPFTFTHPWSADTIVSGIAIGCNTGNQVKELTLNIPSCPNYCDPSTSLSVPPPVVTDACGAVVSNYDASYNLTIKPVPTVSFSSDTIKLCDGQLLSASVNACLPGSTINWSGNGQSGTTLVSDTLHNTGSGVQSTQYTASVSLGGCEGIGDTLIVETWPQAVAGFDVQAGDLKPGQYINFTNTSQTNGNTLGGWLWTFEDSTFQLTQNALQIYADTGSHTVCLSILTTLGCNDTICKTFVVHDVDLVLPNIITPNGDGINDILHIKALEYYPQNTLMVFNRWGNKVYERQNYANDWKAPGLSDGTYYYFLLIPNKPDMQSVLQVVRK